MAKESIIHSKISDKLTEAFEEASAKIGRTHLLMPRHLEDGLFQLKMTKAHVFQNNQMSTNAAPLPRIHLLQTLDYIESEQRLYTTYVSLTSQAITSRIVLNDASLGLHTVGKQRRRIRALNSH